MPAPLVPIGHVDALGACRYQEWRPRSLPATVAALWCSEVQATGPLHVIPDGCVEVVRAHDGSVEIWGPAATTRRVVVHQDAVFDGLRVQPGAASTMLGLPVSDVAGLVVTAQEIGLARLLEGRDRTDWRARALALADDATQAWLSDPVALLAPGLLGVAGSRIPAVAHSLGIGERQLRRRFRHSIGLTPATYRRLVRARHALRDLAAPHPGRRGSIADIAYRHGFTDQSHLTREVTALTGTTPAVLSSHTR